jgi:hypothetical protein
MSLLYGVSYGVYLVEIGGSHGCCQVFDTVQSGKNTAKKKYFWRDIQKCLGAKLSQGMLGKLNFKWCNVPLAESVVLFICKLI